MRTYTTFEVKYLNNDIAELERLYSQLTSASHSTVHQFDLSQVRFLGPQDVIGLVTCARLISQQHGHAIQLTNLNPNVLQYLTRINLFTTASQWLLPPETSIPSSNIQQRQSDHLLELTPIREETDIFEIVQHVRQICLPLQVANLDKILRILSELCQNAYEHSGDSHSMVMVQRYLRPTQSKSEVQIAICDMGMGVRQSLVARYSAFESSTGGYLRAALEGKSARTSGRGGLGLRSIEQIIAEDGGALWLRSDSGSILSHGVSKRRQNDGLALIPGTQVVVKLNGILLDLPPR